MTTLNIQNLRDEVTYFLRSSDVLSTAVRGVTRSTSTYTVGAGGEATHTFTGLTPIRNFKTLTVNGTAKKWLQDYTFVASTGVLTWTSALVLNDVVVYSFDYGSSDKIFPDLPRDDLTLVSYPRVGVELTSISTTPLGLGGTTHISDVVLTVIVWAPVNKDSTVASGYGGMSDLEETMRLIRDAFRTYAKTFYTFTWVTPKGMGPIIKGANGKIMQHSADFMIRFKIE